MGKGHGSFGGGTFLLEGRYPSDGVGRGALLLVHAEFSSCLRTSDV